MNLDAWQTVWACLAFTVIVLGVDGLLASRAGPNKVDRVRQKKRDNRTAAVAGAFANTEAASGAVRSKQGAVNE